MSKEDSAEIENPSDDEEDSSSGETEKMRNKPAHSSGDNEGPYLSEDKGDTSAGTGENDLENIQPIPEVAVDQEYTGILEVVRSNEDDAESVGESYSQTLSEGTGSQPSQPYDSDIEFNSQNSGYSINSITYQLSIPSHSPPLRDSGSPDPLRDIGNSNPQFYDGFSETYLSLSFKSSQESSQ